MVEWKDEKLKNVKVIIPLSTPLGEDEKLDVDGLQRLTDHVIGGGAEGLFILGSCGEGPCFSDAETERVINETVRIVNGRKPVFVGVGKNSTSETVRWAEFAKSAGVDYAVVLPPYYFGGLPEDELFRHYEAINEVGIPIVLYNLGKGNAMSSGLVERLGELDNIVAMKDSTGDLDRFEEIAKLLPTYQGDDSLIFDSLGRGAVGCVPGLGNVFPEWFPEIVGAYNAGDLERARELQERITGAFEVLYKRPSNAQVGVKLGLEALGICGSRMKSPNGQADDDSRSVIKEFVDGHK